MRAVGQPIDDDGRLRRGQRRRAVAVAHDPPALGDVEMAASHRETVRQIQVSDDGDHVRRAADAAPVGQRHHAALRRDRHEQHAVRRDGEAAGAAELFREHIDAEAGRHGDLRRAGHAEVDERQQRAHPPRHEPAGAVSRRVMPTA
jgi:hypothetical protein